VATVVLLQEVARAVPASQSNDFFSLVNYSGAATLARSVAETEYILTRRETGVVPAPTNMQQRQVKRFF
jgi:ribosomal protein S18